MYTKLARWCYRNSWKVIGAWLAILIACAVAIGTIEPAYDSTGSLPDSESQAGFDILEEHFGGLGAGLTGTIVFEADAGVDDPAVVERMSGLFAELNELAATGEGDTDFTGMQVRSPYDAPQQIASQGPRAGEVAYATVSFASDIDQTESGIMGAGIAELIEEQGLDEVDGLNIELGGAALVEFEPPESELLGLAFAVIVLIVAMGSVVAMGTTISVALMGVGIGAMLIGLISNIATVPDFALTIGLMIGLGVGIDYALFIVNRYRESLRAGFPPEQATMVALDTAGRSVVFAGATVVVSLLGLLLIGLGFITGLGIAAATTVTVVMVSSITLLPAALGIVQGSVNVTRWRGMIAAGLVSIALLGLGLSIQPFLIGLPLAVVVALAGYLPFAGPLKNKLPDRKEKPVRETIWYRLSRAVQARPWFWAIASSAVLIILTIPVLDLRLGFSDEGNRAPETTTRQAYDLLAEGFGPGSNGPLLIATEITSPDDLQTLGALSESLNGTEGVAFASPAFPNNEADPTASQAALIQVQPTSSPQDEATSELVSRLRDDVIPAALEGSSLEPKVTGITAANIDFTDFLANRIVVFFVVVLALSFLLLMTVFRSLLVPLKAVIMNMLSIGAAYGLVVALFQKGWGGFFGEGAPIEPFIPMIMFAILFGLSMDYEVFILSRMKEEFERTGDAVNSVADGVAMTARVITAAAAIMVVVFGSFVFEDDRIVKLFGIGLASAVLIDASIVRMILVPATMQLLGAKNWWLPSWLDRLLPNLNVEGGHHEPPAPIDVEGPADPTGSAELPEPELV